MKWVPSIPSHLTLPRTMGRVPASLRTGTETDPQRTDGAGGGGLDSVPGTRKYHHPGLPSYQAAYRPASTLSFKCPRVRFPLRDRIPDLNNLKGKLILISVSLVADQIQLDTLS